MSRQKELDADQKGSQLIELVRKFKKLDNNGNATDVGNDQSIFVLIILEKKQRKMSKVFSRKCNSLIKDSKLRRSDS